MTPLTICRVSHRAPRPAVSLRWMFECVLWASVGTLLALAHVYIKFTTSDLRASARRLQDKREQVENRVAELCSQVTELESREYTLKLAREMGMQVATPEQIEKNGQGDSFVAIPMDLADKYRQRDWRASLRWNETGDCESRANAVERVLAGIARTLGENNAEAVSMR